MELDYPSPMVRLDRVASGLGALHFSAVTDARQPVELSFAVTGADVQEQLNTPQSTNWPLSHPMLRVTDGVMLRLRAVRQFQRFVLAAGWPFSAQQQGVVILTVTTSSRRTLHAKWTTPGPTGHYWPLLTGYQVDGQVVLRAEFAPPGASLADVTSAHGYNYYL